MEHFFSLPVLYKGEEYSLNGRMVTFAYSYKYYLIIENKEIAFERDDERNFQVADESVSDAVVLDSSLLSAVIMALPQLKH